MDLSLLVACAFCGGLVVWWTSQTKPEAPLPPGPPADPVIGHLRIMPKENTAETFHEWTQKYGTFMVIPLVRTTYSFIIQEMSCFFAFLAGRWLFWGVLTRHRNCLIRGVLLIAADQNSCFTNCTFIFTPFFAPADTLCLVWGGFPL
jgi:hypothetical protein